MTKRLLTNEDLAEIFDVPVKTIEKWRYEGTGPMGFRIGKHVRYLPEVVDAWTNEKAGVPNAAA